MRYIHTIPNESIVFSESDIAQLVVAFDPFFFVHQSFVVMMKFLGGILLCLGALHTAQGAGAFTATSITLVSTGINDAAATLTIAFTLDGSNAMADDDILTFAKIGTLTDGSTALSVAPAAGAVCPFDNPGFDNANADITLQANGAIAVSQACSCVVTVKTASAYVGTLTATAVTVVSDSTTAYEIAAQITTQVGLVVTAISSPTAVLTLQTQATSTTLTLGFINGGVALAIGETVTFSNLATLMTTSTAPAASSCTSFTPTYVGNDVVLTLSAAVTADTTTSCQLTVTTAAAYVGTVTSTVVSSKAGLTTAVSVTGTSLNVDYLGFSEAFVGSDYGSQLPAEENLIEFSFKHDFQLDADDTVTFANLGTIGDGGTITLKGCGTDFDAVAYSGSSKENIVVTVQSDIGAATTGCYILLTNSASAVATPVVTVAASTTGLTDAVDVNEFGIYVSSAFGVKGVTFALAMVFLAAVSNMIL